MNKNQSKCRYDTVIILGCISIYILLWWFSGSTSRRVHYGNTYTNIYGYTFMYSIFAGVGIGILLKLLCQMRRVLTGTGKLIIETCKHSVRILINYYLPISLIVSSILVFALDIYIMHRPYLTGLAAYILAGGGIGNLVMKVTQNSNTK